MTDEGYDFWLLDLDGTIVDVRWEYIRSLFDAIGDRLGQTFTDRAAERLWYGFGGDRDRSLRQMNISRDRFWEIFDAVECPIDRAKATTIYPDAATFLPQIEAPMGLVTHCRQDVTETVLEQHDIDRHFDTVVCCSDGLGWKPHPAPVQRAMADLGVLNGQTGVLIGDGENDVGAAWNAGLDGIHIDRHGTSQRGTCVLGDLRVRSFDELPIDRWGPPESPGAYV